MKKKILITGCQGNIGRIITAGLSDRYEIIGIDRKPITGESQIQLDIMGDAHELRNVCRGKDVIIHLAWDMSEDFPKETIIPENKSMAERVLLLAIEEKIPRIIFASSVHAHEYPNPDGGLIDPTMLPIPDSPYGASKVYIEALSRYYARKKSIEIVCIRFGGVNENDEIRFSEDPQYDKVFLSKSDCVSLLTSCIETKKIPNNFGIIYGISDVAGRMHSFENVLHWRPNPAKK